MTDLDTMCAILDCAGIPWRVIDHSEQMQSLDLGRQIGGWRFGFYDGAIQGLRDVAEWISTLTRD